MKYKSRGRKVADALLCRVTRAAFDQESASAVIRPGAASRVKCVLLYERIGLMNEYVLYYLEDRTHLALEKGTPAGREARENPGGGWKVISMPRLGGLPHRYYSAT